MSDLLFSIFPSENFVDLGLYQFGREQCTPSHLYGPAARNHYLFHYVLSGTGRLMSNDSKGVTHEFSIKSGQGFMIFPGQINTYIADERLPWEYVWLEFDGLRVKEAVELAGLTPDTPIYRAQSKELREVMMQEMLYIAQNGSAAPFHLIGHCYLFLDALTRSSSVMRLKSNNKLRDFYIHEALSYIEENFQNDISVEDIARICGLNRSYFSKIFHQTIGKPPQEFLLHYRMAKASELLNLTQLTVGDIGNAVGYLNPLHFSRAFKNVYGVSPRTWRNENHIKSNTLQK